MKTATVKVSPSDASVIMIKSFLNNELTTIKRNFEMRKVHVALAALSILMLAAPAVADKKDKPPPPKKEVDCSPGYYKNHTDVWFGECCDAQSSQCDDILTALEAKGPGGSVLRRAAQGFLDSCFEESPCDDD